MDSQQNTSGVPLLPPSPNWFNSCALDSRVQDRLLVTAAFKTIVVYRVEIGPVLPTMLKSIPHVAGGKVLHVRLFPDATQSVHGSSLAATGEYGAVTLYNIDSGVMVAQHTQHKGRAIGGVCWVKTPKEVFVVSVAEVGIMLVWNVDTNRTINHVVNHNQHKSINQATPPNLTLVEPVPGGDGRVLVVADKIILVVDVKNGIILTQLRGHDQSIYCLRWYCGTEHPLTPTHHNFRAQALLQGTPDEGKGSSINGSPNTSVGSDSNNWRSRPSTSSNDSALSADSPANSSSDVGGPFFASSDTGRNVLVWDLSAQRYVAKTSVAAVGFKKQAGPGGRGGGRGMVQHIALAWRGSQLIVNNSSGHMLSLKLWGTETSSDTICDGGDKAASTGGASSRTIHREHTRVVYNAHVFDDSTLVTSGQDRQLVGYCLATNTVNFKLPTLGAMINTLAFCPHDASWLTLGLQENSIKLINLHSSPPFSSKSFYNTIKGKVMALCWHPNEEGQILFGTGDGQVGIADVNNGKISTFSYFHQKSVYKVEWGPPVLVDQFKELGTSLYAYSFGDREIVMRNPKEHIADPIKLTKVHPSLPADISEFSFSPDFKFFAVGGQDGNISILRSHDLKELVKLILVRKTIQHLLWKPKLSNSSSTSQFNGLATGKEHLQYTLAIASNDTKICIMELDGILKEQLEKVTACEQSPESGDSYEAAIVSSCNRELSGHAGRVVWLSYSSHNPDLLASASYDHTCQVWDTATGEHVGNYRGHITRVFRVEFSPNEAGLLYSFGEENSLHQWRAAHLQHKVPPQKVNKIQEQKPKAIATEQNMGSGAPEGGVSESVVKVSAAVAPVGAKLRKQASPDSDGSSSSATVGVAAITGKRVPAHRALFPLLHNATCHKRSFFLLSILCMEEYNKIQKEIKSKHEEKTLEDLLDEVYEENESDAPPASYYQCVLEKHSTALLLEEHSDPQPAPPAQDINTFLDFYGGPPDHLAAFMDRQVKEHSSKEDGGHQSSSINTVLHSWRGSLEQCIRAAIADKTLTADMVAQAVPVAYELGALASEAYGHQLAEAGDPLTGSTYLLSAAKIPEAVELLLKHKLPREALVVAKLRLPYDTKLHESVTKSFINTVVYEGNYDLGAVLHCSIGDFVSAANTLCRRGDPSSLYVAGLLYQSEGHTLATATFLDCLKLAGSRGQLEKIPAIVAVAPQLTWFRAVGAVADILMRQLSVTRPPGYTEPLTDTVYTLADQDGVTGVDALQCAVSRWSCDSLSSTAQYNEVYAKLQAHLATSQQPISIRQFWFMISVEICKLVLSLLCQPQQQDSSSEGHLMATLQLVLDWGKADQAFDVTHLLLPSGPDAAPSVLSPLFNKENRSKASNLLLRLYYTSEFYVRSLPQTKHAAAETSQKSQDEQGAATSVEGVTASLEKKLLLDGDDANLDGVCRQELVHGPDALVGVIRSLSECLALDCSVTASTPNLYKIDVFRDPKTAMRGSLDDMCAKGMVGESVVTEINKLLSQ